MSFLSKLPKIVAKKKKRLGRGLGSNKGSKSGRGTTRHQKARQSIPLHFEGGQGRMVKRYPLLRGKGRNKSRGEAVQVIGLGSLNVFKDDEIVDAKSLLKKGIIKEDGGSIKILNNGKLEKKLTVHLKVSKSAKSAIEKLGGKVEI